jgi:hypothetical protein
MERGWYLAIASEPAVVFLWRMSVFNRIGTPWSDKLAPGTHIGPSLSPKHRIYGFDILKQ